MTFVSSVLCVQASDEDDLDGDVDSIGKDREASGVKTTGGSLANLSRQLALDRYDVL